jgi:hypothetical protein
MFTWWRTNGKKRPHCDGQKGRESLSEYSGTRIDMRADNLLISACRSERRGGSDLADRGGVRRAGLLIREVRTVGSYPALPGGSLGAVGPRLDTRRGGP